MADPVVHVELTGTDREALGRFYAELFGWHDENLAEPHTSGGSPPSGG